MTEGERERAFRYAFRRYDVLGPVGLASARLRLKSKIIESTQMPPEVFDELLEDLITENGWSEARAMAYFEVIDIEDRI